MYAGAFQGVSGVEDAGGFYAESGGVGGGEGAVDDVCLRMMQIQRNSAEVSSLHYSR